jgi:serine/threonine protein kinase
MTGTDTLEGTLLGEYAIGSKLGQGGMGSVYTAVDGLHREVAVKVLRADLSAAVDVKERFKREMALSLALEHPNLVPVYDIGLEDGRLFIVMRLVRGPNLAEVVADGPVGVMRAARLFADVARALTFMHARAVVHRDVKPQNVFLAEVGGDSEYAMLGDLGIARAIDSATHLTRGGWIGTPAYMAPEQFKGLPASPQSDVYSLGCIGYELLTGRPPFGGEFDEAERAQLPAIVQVLAESEGEGWRRAGHLEEVIHRALDVSPDRRYGSASEFARAFTRTAEVTHGQRAVEPHARLEDAVVELMSARGGGWLSAEEIAALVNEHGLFRREVAPAEVASRLRNNGSLFQRDGSRFRQWPRSTP